MVEYPVPGLRCMFCRYRLMGAIRKIDPELEVKIDLRTERAGVRSQAEIRTVERALAYLKELADA